MSPRRSNYARNPLERTVLTSSGCLEWQGKLNKQGYGQTALGAGKSILAHRKVWIQTFGPIPGGLWVLHRCDNPKCINPEHLFLGNRVDNMLDMSRKGRSPYSKKTHCPRGHPYTPLNTLREKHLRANGRIGSCRVCRACRSERNRQYYQARKTRKTP